MIDDYIKLVHMKAALGNEYGCAGLHMTASGYGYDCIGLRIWLHRVTDITA